MKIILVIIISICQALITSIPIYNKKLSDNRRPFPKNLTASGKWMIAFIVVTIICTLFLFDISENEQSKFQQTLNDTLRVRDSRLEKREDQLTSIYSIRLDSSYKKSSQNFNEVLLKYGLHFDSLNNRLVKQIDTTKRQVTLQKISPPELYLDTIKVTAHPNNLKRFTFYFKNNKDEAKQIAIKMFVMVLINGEFKKIGNPSTIDIDQLIDGRPYQWPIDFLRTDLYNYKTYFFYFDGGYHDKTSGYYKFKYLVSVDGDNYEVRLPNGSYKEGLMSILKSLYPPL